MRIASRHSGWCLSPLLALLLPWAGCFGSCGPSGPSQDTCDTPQDIPIATLEIGSGGIAAQVPDQSPFVALADGDTIGIVRGGQGAEMIIIRLRTTGGSPMCLTQTTTVDDAMGNRLNNTSAALHFYPQADGKSVTSDIFLPGSYDTGAGATVTVTSTAGHRTQTRHLVTGQLNGCQATEFCLTLCQPGATGCRKKCLDGLRPASKPLYEALEKCLAMACGTSGGAAGNLPDAGPSTDAATRNTDLKMSISDGSMPAFDGATRPVDAASPAMDATPPRDAIAPPDLVAAPCSDPAAADCNDCRNRAKSPPAQCTSGDPPSCGACSDPASVCSNDN